MQPLQLEACSVGEEEGKNGWQHGIFEAGALAYRLLDRPGPEVWEEIRVNLGDEGEKVDGNLQQVRKDPSGKVNHLKLLTIMLPPLQG